MLDPSKPMPDIASVAHQSMASVFQNAPLGTDIPFYSGMTSDLQDMSGDPYQEGKEDKLAAKAKKLEKQRLRDAREKKAWEKKKQEAIDKMKREIKEREENAMREALESEKKKIDSALEKNRKDFEEKLKRRRERKERNRINFYNNKMRKEIKQRDKEEKLRKLWVHFRGLCIFHMAPYIVFEQINVKIMGTKVAILQKQTNLRDMTEKYFAASSFHLITQKSRKLVQNTLLSS